MPQKDSKKPTYAIFKITLDVAMDIGNKTLDEALAEAKTFEVYDVVGIEGLEHNDSTIEVTGVYHI